MIQRQKDHDKYEPAHDGVLAIDNQYVSMLERCQQNENAGRLKARPNA